MSDLASDPSPDHGHEPSVPFVPLATPPAGPDRTEYRGEPIEINLTGLLEAEIDGRRFESVGISWSTLDRAGLFRDSFRECGEFFREKAPAAGVTLDVPTARELLALFVKGLGLDPSEIFAPALPAAPLAAPYDPRERPGIVIPYRCGREAIQKGALVGVCAAGDAVPLGSHTPMRFLGVANESGVKGRALGVAKMGTFVYPAYGFDPTPHDLGRVVYAASDHQVALDPAPLTYVVAVGTIVAIEPTPAGGPGVRVRIDLHTV